MTWSVFGTLPPRSPWLGSFVRGVFPEAAGDFDAAQLWEQQVHPHSGGAKGPEADVCIRHPLVVVEGKWQADLGDKQGRPPIHTQLEMRAIQVRAAIGSAGVLVIALPSDVYEHARKGVFGRYFSPNGDGYQLRDAARALGVPLRVLTWRDVRCPCETRRPPSRGRARGVPGVAPRACAGIAGARGGKIRAEGWRSCGERQRGVGAATSKIECAAPATC